MPEFSGVDDFTVRTDERDGVVIVTIAGELDMATAPRASVVLKDATGRGNPVVIDMTGLRFFSSAGLTLLVQLDDQRRTAPTDIRLVGDQRVVLRPLELTGLLDLFPVHTTLDAALAAAR
jgi:anti-anti-sigma factor